MSKAAATFVVLTGILSGPLWAQNGPTLTIAPGERVVIKTSGHADNENCLSVYNASSGETLKHWNSHFLGGWGTFELTNSGTDHLVLRLVGWHKAHPPGDGPWDISSWARLDVDSGYRVYGWEDSRDNDFDDVICVVTWVPSSPQE